MINNYNYPFATSGIYNVIDTNNINKMEQLRKRIEAIMSENESIMANAVKISANRSGNAERCISMYSNAKKENAVYKNVLTEMDKIVAGRIADGGGNG